MKRYWRRKHGPRWLWSIERKSRMLRELRDEGYTEEWITDATHSLYRGQYLHTKTHTWQFCNRPARTPDF